MISTDLLLEQDFLRRTQCTPATTLKEQYDDIDGYTPCGETVSFKHQPTAQYTGNVVLELEVLTPQGWRKSWAYCPVQHTVIQVGDRFYHLTLEEKKQLVNNPTFSVVTLSRKVQANQRRIGHYHRNARLKLVPVSALRPYNGFNAVS